MSRDLIHKQDISKSSHFINMNSFFGWSYKQGQDCLLIPDPELRSNINLVKTHNWISHSILRKSDNTNKVKHNYFHDIQTPKDLVRSIIYNTEEIRKIKKEIKKQTKKDAKTVNEDIQDQIFTNIKFTMQVPD